jgi:FkbM family methyltransferase
VTRFYRQADPNDNVDEPPPGEVIEVHVGSHQWQLLVPPDDHIGRVISESHAPYESTLLHRAAALLKKGDIVVDVGANIGNHALYLAVVSGARVVAVEPNPVAAAYLHHNVRLNSLAASVWVVDAACASREGSAHVASTTPGNLGETVLGYGSGPLRVVTIDGLLRALDIRSGVRLVKIDVEGSEVAVLRGARELLAREHPWIVAEAASPGHVRAIDAQLGVHGYERDPVNLAWTPTYLWRPL